MLQGHLQIHAVKFPAGNPVAGIAPALLDVAATGAVRIAGIYFIERAPDGALKITGLDQLSAADQAAFAPAMARDRSAAASFIPETDLVGITPLVALGESALALLLENVWATRLATSLHRVHATLLMQHGVPGGDLLVAGNIAPGERLAASTTVLPDSASDDVWERDALFNKALLVAESVEPVQVETQVFSGDPDAAALLGEVVLMVGIEEELDGAGGKDSTGAIYG